MISPLRSLVVVLSCLLSHGFPTDAVFGLCSNNGPAGCLD